MLKFKWFPAILLMASVLFLSQTGWSENLERNWQIIQHRLSEGVPSGEQVNPVVRSGSKDGGDLLWWLQGIENVECVSEFVDADGDALPDVLIESYDAGAPAQDHFFCIKGNSPGYGDTLWSCRPIGGASSGGGYGDQCVSYTEDLNGDGHADALLGTAWGGRTAYALDGTSGDVIWSYDTYDHPPDGWIYSICPITDLTEDGIPDVLFCAGSDANAAYCVNGANGSLIWKFTATDAVVTVAEIEDVDEDGYSDAVIGGGDNEHRVICLSGHSFGTPSIIWQFNTGAGLQDVSIIEDVDGDGFQDVVAGGWADKVFCLSGVDGDSLWAYNLGAGGVVMKVVPIADINDDGYQDVLVGSWLSAIILLSGANGNVLCSYPTGDDTWSVDGVEDINGDGYPEAVGGSFNYKVYCVDLRACDTLWTYYTGNRLLTVRGLPDVDGNTTPDVLAGTQMLKRSGGKAYCIQGGLSLDTIPDVVSTSPAQNELNVSVSTNISVTFDIDMDETTINDSTFVVNAWSTGLHQGTITYDSPTKTATLDPSEDFEIGEIVTVVLTTDIQSSQEVPLESSYVWSFTTEVSEESPGVFESHSVYPVGGIGPQSVFATDLDGDGDLDLATSDWGVYDDADSVVSVLLNDGDGTFTLDSVYVVGNRPRSLFAADLDRDGYPDLATSNTQSHNVSALLNNGDGTFSTDSVYPAPYRPVSVYAADLDGDGDIDLATATGDSAGGTGYASVLLNKGDGTFALDSAYWTGGGGGHTIIAADLDSDGDLDLVAEQYGAGKVAVLMNHGDGTFAPYSHYPVGGYAWSVCAADLDSDGHLDLATGNVYFDSVSVLLNHGDGTFAPVSHYPVGIEPNSVFAADLDGDGDLDLASANAGSHNVSVLFNNGDGTFGPHSVYAVFAGGRPASVFAADFDSDGDLDLATANWQTHNVSVLLNCLPTGDCNGDGVINSADVVYLINYLFKGGPAPEPLGAGDVNCDGVINSADVVYLINFLFKGGPPPECC